MSASSGAVKRENTEPLLLPEPLTSCCCTDKKRQRWRKICDPGTAFIYTKPRHQHKLWGSDFRGRVKTLDLVILLLSSKRFTSDENQQIASLLMNRKVVCVGFHLASAGVAMSVWTPMAMGTPPQRMLPSSSDTATL